MPYIVTTKDRPGEHGLIEVEMPVSRRAVATLDEAREAARDRVAEYDGRVKYGVADAKYTALHLPEQGGTVGPLPDGAVIEVESITNLQLAERVAGIQHPRIGAPMAGFALRQGVPYMLTAYNAAQ